MKTGRELEFIVRSLVELKLQVEELRRRIDESRPIGEMVGEVHTVGPVGARAVPAAVSGVATVSGVSVPGGVAGAIEPEDAAPPPNVVTVTPGMTMAEIERAAIEAALRETRGNRRKAAEMLGIGERTLYRKLQEYQPRNTQIDASNPNP